MYILLGSKSPSPWQLGTVGGTTLSPPRNAVERIGLIVSASSTGLQLRMRSSWMIDVCHMFPPTRLQEQLTQFVSSSGSNPSMFMSWRLLDEV